MRKAPAALRRATLQSQTAGDSRSRKNLGRIGEQVVLRIVRARLIFGTVRLIVITRMCERTHLPVGRQVTNCQKRVTSR